MSLSQLSEGRGSLNLPVHKDVQKSGLVGEKAGPLGQDRDRPERVWGGGVDAAGCYVKWRAEYGSLR